MCLSVIIPIYNYDDHLTICLLSILGQVQMHDIEIICVPVSTSAAWTWHDDRVIIAKEASNLSEALRQGISVSQGTYVLFMNQTDTVTSASNLVKAVETAEKEDVQVFLSPKLRRKGINAFSETESKDINTEFLPKNLKDIFSISEAGSGILLSDYPLPYGNIYKRSYLSSLFHGNQSFGNAGDMLISTIALLHAERICISDTALIENRHEGFHHPILTADELQAAEKRIAVQAMLTLATPAAKTIARNVMVMYLCWLISSCHPFSFFCQTKEHYKDILLMTDITKYDAVPKLFPYWQYLRLLSTSTGDDLIELYSYSYLLQTNECE